MQPGDIIPSSFDVGLVILSFTISALGAYVALLAGSRIPARDGGVNKGYVVVASVALGGVGIWGMHFIGIVAQQIPVGVSYGLVPTLISLAVALCFSGAALWYVGKAPVTFGRCLVGGILAGGGVIGMHYLGMDSMRMNAYFEWNPLLVLASALIAVIAACASLWMAFKLRSEIQRMGAALLMAVGVCGMHYVGMMAGVLVCTTPQPVTGMQFEGGVLPYAVFLVSMVALIVMRVELHRSPEELRHTAV
jgi:NO-binding membrane sensor protein with MHYT domain